MIPFDHLAPHKQKQYGSRWSVNPTHTFLQLCIQKSRNRKGCSQSHTDGRARIPAHVLTLDPTLPTHPHPQARSHSCQSPGPSLLLRHCQRGPWKLERRNGRMQSRSNSPRLMKKSCCFPAQLTQAMALPPWPNSKDRTRAIRGLLQNNLH